jgi:uncharacterized membrane protein YkvA (DUF1232 family)
MWDVILWVALGLLLALLAASVVAWFLWRRASAQTRLLMHRIQSLPFTAKLNLAGALLPDSRIPLGARAVVPALVLYLMLPLDIVPDFIPVLGQLDDLLVAVGAVCVLLRFTPRPVLEEHLSALEQTQVSPNR